MRLRSLAFAVVVAIFAACGDAPPISIPTPGDDGATDTTPSDVLTSPADAGR